MAGTSSTMGASMVAIINGLSRSCSCSILTLLLMIDAGLDVTDLGESHGKSPQLHIKIFIDDSKEPVKKMALENHNSTHKIPQPFDL